MNPRRASREARRFDEAAANYAETVARANRLSGRGPAFFSREKARVLESIASTSGIVPPVSLLDVGCGVGTLHSHLDLARFAVVGVDPSPESVGVARERNPAADYVVAEAGHIPLPTASVDLAVAVCVFHHIIPSERHAAASEMTRVVRPGGQVIVIEHNPWNPYTRYSVASCPFDEDAILLRRAETETLLRQAGVPAPRTQYISWTPVSHRLNAAIERVVGRLPLGTQYATWGSVASP